MPNLNHVFPKHIAIIMDGNGRWAIRRGKLRAMGHRAGLEKVRQIVYLASKKRLPALTLYAFSRENWRRPAAEVMSLMSLFTFALKREINDLHENNIKLRIVGDTSCFNCQLQKMIYKAEQLTMYNTGLVLSIAANYGGRWDIIEATKKLVNQIKNNQLSIDAIDESLFTQQLSLSDLPEIDLVIRTGGEYRISNFLLWQIAYAEFYFTETLWPDFDEKQFMQAIRSFQSRERRFGRTKGHSEVMSC